MRPGRLCGRGSKLSTIRNGHPAAPGGLQCSRLSVQHGHSASSHRPALTLARCSVAAHRSRLRRRGVPALRTPFGRVLAPPAALRPSIAHCALLRVLATPALRASDVRKLTRGAPCFTGLIGGYCTLNSQWSSCCALRLAVLPCSLGLLRPVSRTARGEAPSHWARASCAPLLARGAFWVVAQPYEVALPKSLPLAPKGGGTAQP